MSAVWRTFSGSEWVYKTGDLAPVLVGDRWLCLAGSGLLLA